MILVSTPPGTRLPLETLIGTGPERMEANKDPQTGMITMVRAEPKEMDDEGVVYRLTMDMVGFAQDTPHADDADVDALILLLHDAGSILDLIEPSRAVMLRLAENGHPYPYAERLTRSLDTLSRLTIKD